VTQYGSKLIRKIDLARAVAAASHLFWSSAPAAREYKDGKLVKECLQRALKVAGSPVDATTKVTLYIELLNQYLYYFEHKDTNVPQHVSGLISLIHGALPYVTDTTENTNLNISFQNTLQYIKRKQHSNPEYMEIKLSPPPPKQPWT